MSTPEPEPLPRRHALQQRVTAAILEAAARVLADRGEQASMADVATAAGVARATLYRYFPSRQALLQELARLAVDQAATRLAAARTDEIPVEEALPRAVRALVEVGDYLVVLARERLHADPGQVERHLAAPLRRLVERGQRSREIRDDVPGAWLADALVALVVGILGSRPALGRDDTVVAITSLYLEGARAARARRR
jgi:TetR/AcrR family transcriptional repressor of mexCD-oprJ operon